MATKIPTYNTASSVHHIDVPQHPIAYMMRDIQLYTNATPVLTWLGCRRPTNNSHISLTPEVARSPVHSSLILSASMSLRYEVSVSPPESIYMSWVKKGHPSKNWDTPRPICLTYDNTPLCRYLTPQTPCIASQTSQHHRPAVLGVFASETAALQALCRSLEIELDPVFRSIVKGTNRQSFGSRTKKRMTVIGWRLLLPQFRCPVVEVSGIHQPKDKLGSHVDSGRSNGSGL